jgi:hypothetical protein
MSFKVESILQEICQYYKLQIDLEVLKIENRKLIAN